jgi:hypothetical protein
MTATQHLVLAGGLLVLCAITVGLLTRGGGLIVHGPDHAALRGARAGIHDELERMESAAPGGRPRDDRLWRVHLDLVEQELARGRVDGAVRAWYDAYGAALASRTWPGMIAVGDAFIAIGRAAGTPGGARMNARESYLTAVIRARREGSVEGVLRAAEAFGQLDERASVEHCLHIAAQLATGNEAAQRRLGEFRQRWAARNIPGDSELAW